MYAVSVAATTPGDGGGSTPITETTDAFWFKPELDFDAGVASSINLAQYASHLTGGTVKMQIYAGYHADLSFTGNTTLAWSGSSGTELEDEIWISAWIDNGVRGWYNPRTGHSFTSFENMKNELVEGLDTEVLVEPKIYDATADGRGYFMLLQANNWNMTNGPFTIRSAVPGARAIIRTGPFFGGVVTWFGNSGQDMTGGVITLRDLDIASFNRYNPDNAACVVPGYGNNLIINVTRAHFHNTCNGILGGQIGTTWNITGSIFEHNGNSGDSGGSATHNLYLGGQQVNMTGCWSKSCYQGHLFKSRARENNLVANRLITEQTAQETKTESFNIDVPDGGDVLLKGNIVVQEGVPENDIMIRMGEESVSTDGRTHRFRAYQNTIVNRSAVNATFISVNAAITDRDIKDNVFCGTALDSGSYTANNSTVAVTDFIDPDERYYKLKTQIGAATEWTDVEYVHPAQTRARTDRKRGAFFWAYDLPTADCQVKQIALNTLWSLKPSISPAMSDRDWADCCVAEFGGGAFVPDASEAGKFSCPGTGGHGAPTNLGDWDFDLDTGLFGINYPNGTGTTYYRSSDYHNYETTGVPRYEVTAASPEPIPTPSHGYTTHVALPMAQGGGPQGSVLWVFRTVVTWETGASGYAHRWDKSTSTWSRYSVGAARHPNPSSTAINDPIRKRIWTGPYNSTEPNQEYLDTTDLSFHITPDFASAGGTPHAWEDGSYLMLGGLLLKHTQNFGTQTNPTPPNVIQLWCYDPDNPDPVHSVVQVNVTGTWPADGGTEGAPITAGYGVRSNHWQWVPDKGRFYKVLNDGASVIWRLTPPAGWATAADLKNGTWTVDSQPLSEALPPAAAQNQAYECSRWFYSTRLKMLVYISGAGAPYGTAEGGVQLIQPI